MISFVVSVTIDTLNHIDLSIPVLLEPLVTANRIIAQENDCEFLSSHFDPKCPIYYYKWPKIYWPNIYTDSLKSIHKNITT